MTSIILRTSDCIVDRIAMVPAAPPQIRRRPTQQQHAVDS